MCQICIGNDTGPMDIAELPREVEKLDRDWIVATLSSGILSDGREVDGVRYMMPNAECL